MNKEHLSKDDGRYIIFYAFADEGTEDDEKTEADKAGRTENKKRQEEKLPDDTRQRSG
jgi:hypothetical protein